jgi:RNA-directed DNA polymerase
MSPLLSNIVLDELDQELHGCNHSFVGYADDLLIFVKHKEKAWKVKQKITEVITSRMKLKVNESKSGTRKIGGGGVLRAHLFKQRPVGRESKE